MPFGGCIIALCNVWVFPFTRRKAYRRSCEACHLDESRCASESSITVVAKRFPWRSTRGISIMVTPPPSCASPHATSFAAPPSACRRADAQCDRGPCGGRFRQDLATSAHSRGAVRGCSRASSLYRMSPDLVPAQSCSDPIIKYGLLRPDRLLGGSQIGNGLLEV